MARGRRRGRSHRVSFRLRHPISAHRLNPGSGMILPLGRISTGRKRRHGKRRRGLTVGWHRPKLRWAFGKWSRPKHSRLMHRSVRVNPRHRRRSRRNPFNIKGSVRNLMNKQWLMGVLVIGGGFAGAFAAKSLVTTAMTKLKMGNNLKYAGAGSILLGALMFGMLKQRALKQIGAVIAGAGAYDLIAQFTGGRLPALPSVDVMSMIPGAKALSGSYPVRQLPVSPVSRLASNYGLTARAGYSGSYQAPGMVTQGLSGQSEPYEGVDW